MAEITATEVLGVTADEVIEMLNPLSDTGLIEEDGPDGVPSSVVLSHAQRQESVALSSIPEPYRVLCREVKGEILTRDAYAGQMTAQLGLYPIVAGTLALYVDFPCERGTARTGVLNAASGDLGRLVINRSEDFGAEGYVPYSTRSRWDRLAENKYSVDNSTGAITLTEALAQGQKLYADYRHTGMARCESLRDIVIRLAAAAVGKSLPRIAQAAWTQLDDMDKTARAMLLAVMRGEAGIDLLDQLELVNETRAADRIPQKSFVMFW